MIQLSSLWRKSHSHRPPNRFGTSQTTQSAGIHINQVQYTSEILARSEARIFLSERKKKDYSAFFSFFFFWWPFNFFHTPPLPLKHRKERKRKKKPVQDLTFGCPLPRPTSTASILPTHSNLAPSTTCLGTLRHRWAANHKTTRHPPVRKRLLLRSRSPATRRSLLRGRTLSRAPTLQILFRLSLSHHLVHFPIPTNQSSRGKHNYTDPTERAISLHLVNYINSSRSCVSTPLLHIKPTALCSPIAFYRPRQKQLSQPPLPHRFPFSQSPWPNL